MSRTIRSLPNLGSVREVFARLRSRPGAILLESSAIMTGMGRWSYIVTDPAATLETRGDETRFQLETWDDPFTALETLLKRYELEPQHDGPDFQGGFVGYLGYDLARHLEHLPNNANADLNWPEMRQSGPVRTHADGRCGETIFSTMTASAPGIGSTCE